MQRHQARLHESIDVFGLANPPRDEESGGDLRQASLALQTANTALDQATRRLEALNASLSDYVSTSELSRLSAAAGRGYWHLLPDDLGAAPHRWHELGAGSVAARLVDLGHDRLGAGQHRGERRADLVRKPRR